MRFESTNSPTSEECSRWEALLADALDGQLNLEDKAAFSSHLLSCPACSALMEEARKGSEWLHFLETEPDVPAGLLEKILARTGPGKPMGQGIPVGDALPMPPVAVMLPAWQRAGIGGRIRQYAQPQLLMTAAMAFFSIALTLSLTGFSPRNLNLASLRPRAVRSVIERRVSEASTPIVRYYDRLLLVCEVEARTRVPRLAGQSEGRSSSGSGSRKSRQVVPGESKSVPGQPNERSGANGRQQARNQPQDNSNQLLETPLNSFNRYLQPGGSALAARERSTIWTA